MAFNPFHGFRKHQKAFMAALAIMCMFMFVLTGSMSTGWDFFMGIGQVFGLSASRPDTAATLYAKPVSINELYQLRTQREIANQYVLNAMITSSHWAEQRIRMELPRAQFTPDSQSGITRLLMQIGQYRSFMVGQQFNEETRRFILSQLRRDFDNLQNIQMTMSDPQRMPDRAIIETLRALISQDSVLYSRLGGLFFGGSLESKALLDFMIWQRQAEDLGIQLSTENVKALLNHLIPTGLSQEDDRQIQASFGRRFRNYSPELLLGALRDEFRVQMAQEAMLGADSQFMLPVALTPHQLWEYYQEQRTENTIVLLPIPVHHAEFLNKAGEATEAELKELYEKNKERLYDPGAEEAGFKQPGRFQLEWVGGTPDSPQIQHAVDVTLAALQLSQPLSYAAAVIDEYRKTRMSFDSPSWISYQFTFHDSSRNQPAVVANTVAQALAGVGTGTPAFVDGWAGYLSSASRLELVGRARAAANVLLTGASAAPMAAMAGAPPSAEVAGPVLATAFQRAEMPESPYLSLAAIRPFVDERLRNDMAKELLQNAMMQFSNDLRRRTRLAFPLADPRTSDAVRQQAGAIAGIAAGGTPLTASALAYKDLRSRGIANAEAVAALVLGNTTASAPLSAAAAVYYDGSLRYVDAREKIDQVVKRWGLKRGGTVKARDQYDVAEDTGIAPLKAIMNRGWGPARSSKSDREFARDLTNKLSGMYDPQTADDFLSGEQFRFWKTDDKGPYVPSFEEARDKVLARWLADKARPLAEEEAKRVAAKIREMKVSELEAVRALRDESKYGGPIIHLDKVSPLEDPPSAMPTQQGGQFQHYRIPETKVEHAGVEMIKKLHELKVPGETAVVHDRPRDHYYVAVLERRNPIFVTSFFRDAQQPNKRNGLTQKYDEDTKIRTKRLESIMEQLRATAGLVVDEERIKESGSAEETQ